MSRRHTPACPLAIVVALLVLLGAPVVAGAATPEQIRDCIERNGTRYVEPDRAVDAQYADAQTACAAAIDAGDVVVDFQPGAGDERARRAKPEPRGAEAAGGDSNGDAGGAAAPGPRGGGSDGSPATQSDSPPAVAGNREADVARATPSSAELVRAAASGQTDVGSPFPTSVSGAPAWLYGVLGGAAALILVALITAIRRRLS